MKAYVNFKSNRLVCPNCLELLSRDDIEGFGCCPYCDYRFEMDLDLEDFLLRPVVKQWVAFTRHSEEFDPML